MNHNRSITLQLEQKLTISNLVFLAISKLSISQLEIMRKINYHESINPESLIEETERRLGIRKEKTLNEIEELGELRLITSRTKRKVTELELTDLGKLITIEVERKV